MKILLTGAAGFIGSHLARLLVREGHTVTALVRAQTNLRRIEDIRANLTFAQADFFDTKSIAAALTPGAYEVCLHLAWFISPGTHPNSLKNIEYTAASMRFLELLDSLDCKRTVITGTCLEQDTRAERLSETSPIAPQNFYSSCKHALHVMAEGFQKRQKRGFAWARLFNSYGPWEYDGPLVPDVIQKLLADQACDLTMGTQQRDFLHVEDVASALLAIAQSGMDGDFNIGSGRPVAVGDVARLIGRLLKREHLLHFGARPLTAFDCPICYADSSRLQEKTGWRPRIGLEEGLSTTIDWWRLNKK